MPLLIKIHTTTNFMSRKNYNVPKMNESNIKKLLTITYPIKIDHPYYRNRLYQCKFFFIDDQDNER